MKKLEILQLSYNTYGLIIALKELLLNLEDFKGKNKRELTGILSLVNIIEESAYKIKASLEESVTIQR